jgi:hypothetical protein
MWVAATLTARQGAVTSIGMSATSTAKHQRPKLHAERHLADSTTGENVMAKGQMRSNKEKKKPKTSTKGKKGATAPNQPFATKPEPPRKK